MKLTIQNIQGNPTGEHEVAFPLIENGKGTQAVHDTVVAHLANRRQGTACTKTVGDVAGTGKKPWRQKGTGRARAGSFQSPLWPGGGVVFGPKPRDFGHKIPKAIRQLALRKALSERLKAGDVVVVDELKLEAPKTREFTAVLGALKLSGKALVVLDGENPNVRLAARNVTDVELAQAAELNTYQVLHHPKLLFTRTAFAKVEQRLK